MSTDSDLDRVDRVDRIRQHYGSPRLLDRIRAAMAEAGLDPDEPTREDLAPVEEFHLGGREATRELARVADFGPGDRILDIGAGMGGPARTLVVEFGCEVVALEPTPEFCEVAAWLNDRLALDERVSVVKGHAPELDLPDASFDGAMTQHITMNVRDKAELFRQCRRILRSGGRLAFYEICRGPGGDVRLPVPWADEPAMSHLEDPDDVLRMAETAGFEALQWKDVTAQEAERFHELLASVGGDGNGGPPPLGPHLFIGESMPVKLENLQNAFEEDRIRVVRGVLKA